MIKAINKLPSDVKTLVGYRIVSPDKIEIIVAGERIYDDDPMEHRPTIVPVECVEKLDEEYPDHVYHVVSVPDEYVTHQFCLNGDLTKGLVRAIQLTICGVLFLDGFFARDQRGRFARDDGTPLLKWQGQPDIDNLSRSHGQFPVDGYEEDIEDDDV